MYDGLPDHFDFVIENHLKKNIREHETRKCSQTESLDLKFHGGSRARNNQQMSEALSTRLPLSADQALVAAVAVELSVLKGGARPLVHIPGLAFPSFEQPFYREPTLRVRCHRHVPGLRVSSRCIPFLINY